MPLSIFSILAFSLSQVFFEVLMCCGEITRFEQVIEFVLLSYHSPSFLIFLQLI